MTRQKTFFRDGEYIKPQKPKISGMKLCEYLNHQYGTNFISLMPPNLYGYNDHFEKENSHVISALLTKFHEAKTQGHKSVPIWGSGSARREFLFTEDLVDAMEYFMINHDHKSIGQFVNVGTGEDILIRDLALTIKDITGFKGEIVFDTSRPDGMPQKP